MAALVCVAVVIWRRRVSRRRAGLEIAALREPIAHFAALTWFTERTVTGRHIYAIGGNAEAARRAGIPVGAVRIGVFALIGMLAGLGGVLSASRQFAISIGTGGGTLLLDAIAAAVIGGFFWPRNGYF